MDLRPRAASVPLLEASRGVGVGKSSRGLGALAGGTMAGHRGAGGLRKQCYNECTKRAAAHALLGHKVACMYIHHQYSTAVGF